MLNEVWNTLDEGYILIYSTKNFRPNNIKKEKKNRYYIHLKYMKKMKFSISALPRETFNKLN